VLSFHLYAITHEHMRTRVVKLNADIYRAAKSLAASYAAS